MRSLRGWGEDYAVPVALAAVALVCAISLTHGFLLIIETPHDIYIPLGAGARWLDGVIPSRDYPSPIGPLYACLHGLMLALDRSDARSVIRADFCILLINYLLLWPICRGLPRLTCAALILLLAGLMMTPLALDSAGNSYRYIADYNRWAWGFLTVVLVWGFNANARGGITQAAVGLALCFLLYIKLTLFAAALVLLCLSLLGGRRARDLAGPLMLVLAAILTGSVAGILVPYIGDNMDLSKVTPDVVRIDKFVQQILHPYNSLPTILAITLCFARTISGRMRALVLLSTLVLHLGGLQNFDLMIPMIALPLLLVAPQLPQDGAGWFRPALAQLPGLVQMTGLFLVAAWALIQQPNVARGVQAQPLGPAGTLGSRIFMPLAPNQNPRAGGGDLPYVDDVLVREFQSAQQLLADQPAGTKVATLEIANIALIGWPRVHPAPGTLLWYDYQRDYSEDFYQNPLRAFIGADVILVPRRFTTSNIRRLTGLYQPWLERCAIPIAANDLWQLYRPRQDDKSCAD